MENTQLKSVLRELFTDFYEEPLPELTPRLVTIPELPRNASVVTGMRRTGKTFLLYQRMKELLSNGVPLDRMLYLNLEDDRLLGFSVEDFRYVSDVYYQMYPDNRDKTCYFFFDEIQNVEHWESFARRMVDTPHVQIYLSGSSAKMLTTEIATAMRGRSIEIENFPLSFEEFLIRHKYFDTIPRNISAASRSKIQNGLDKYFIIGGMPDVQEVSDQLRVTMLQGYVNTVIYADVAERHKIPNTQTLKFIMQMIFNNPARPLSIHKISGYLQNQQLNTSREYVADYLDFLTESYLLHRVSLHAESAGKRRANPDKYYLNDIGIIRAMRLKHAIDAGPLLENLVFLQLRRKGYKLEYVQAADGSEVDFLAFHQTQLDYRLYQVCYDMSRPETFEREVSVIREVGDSLGIKERYIVTWDEERELDGGIKVIPAWKFLLDRD